MRLEPVGPAISLDDAGVSLGGNAVLRGVSLEVASGEVIGIAGPNGSGKSTLLRLMAALLAPDRGHCTVLGAELGSPRSYEVRSRIGLISHVPAVIGELTLRENLVHAVRLTGADVARVDTALRAVGLEDAGDVRAEHASFGMLRRTEVARLLITRPAILLLDEAFSGLDGDAQELIDALIVRTQDSAGAAVMVSHDTAHVGSRADRILGLRGGRLEALA
jgi:heme exporter protein A